MRVAAKLKEVACTSHDTVDRNAVRVSTGLKKEEDAPIFVIRQVSAPSSSRREEKRTAVNREEGIARNMGVPEMGHKEKCSLA